MRKSIGIITICKTNNYGAELQAFATQRKLKQLGYNAEIIDYLYYKSRRFKDSKISKPWMKQTIKDKVVYWLKYRFVNWLIETILPLILSSVKYRNKRFADFHKDNTRFSKPYRSMDALYGDIPSYDVYMTGSDQVWNPSALSSIEPYFLTFAPRNKRKISYASSFGVSKIDTGLMERYQSLLSMFDIISVRENTGQVLAKELTGKDVEWVVDPTLLLEKKEWMSVSKLYPSMPEKYVLIYQLSSSQTIVDLALHIGKVKEIPVYRITKRAFCVKRNEGVVNIQDAGPAEFLSLIAGASYVVTNSFHGTVFSINFSIPFYTVVAVRKHNNSRMESLLQRLGLSERLLLDNVNINGLDVDSCIEFKEVHAKLESFKASSIRFLLNAVD